MEKLLPDIKETYWGSIETARRWPVAIKRITMREGTQSSLEFHIKKAEIYWVLSGRLKVGMRVGRGENTSVELGPGECFHIQPGDMHMRQAITDCVIMEACDSENDVRFVADGKTYNHVEGHT